MVKLYSNKEYYFDNYHLKKECNQNMQIWESLQNKVGERKDHAINLLQRQFNTIKETNTSKKDIGKRNEELKTRIPELNFINSIAFLICQFLSLICFNIDSR